MLYANEVNHGYPRPVTIVRDSLRSQVSTEIRAAIVAGEMRPGVVYSAPALAEQYAVSATPVREAMLDLVTEGLVEPVRNKGFRVTELSEATLDEIIAIRSLLEPTTVADLARRMDEPDLRAAVDALRPLAQHIVDAVDGGSLIAYVEADRRFHLELLGLAGNRQLVDLVGSLRARSRLYGLQSLADAGQLRPSALEHHEILEIVLSGDAAGAEALMLRHLGHVRGKWATAES